MAKTTRGGAPAKAGRTYKIIDVVGTSPDSYEAAIGQAIRDASRTLRGLAWFEVAELRGVIQDDHVLEYQASLRIGFRVLPAGDRPVGA